MICYETITNDFAFVVVSEQISDLIQSFMNKMYFFATIFSCIISEWRPNISSLCPSQRQNRDPYQIGCPI